MAAAGSMPCLTGHSDASAAEAWYVALALKVLGYLVNSSCLTSPIIFYLLYQQEILHH